MNLLFCGDRCIEDGLIIAVTSLLKNTEEELHIFVLTMEISTAQKQFTPVSAQTAEYLEAYMKKENPANSLTRIDLTDEFRKELPEANMETRFTPYCMLRLFSDEIEEIPDRILYLDADVICRRDISGFYHQDMEGREVAGVLDYYGRFFFRRDPFHMDYINSGVLLMNMQRIRETGLFQKCRERCRSTQMFMPDQSAINKLAESKKICSRKYNEQRKLHQDTIIQHFTTSFRFFPWLHTLTVKPWQIERVHRELKLYEYDDILQKYKSIKMEIEGL